MLNKIVTSIKIDDEIHYYFGEANDRREEKQRLVISAANENRTKKNVRSRRNLFLNIIFDRDGGDRWNHPGMHGTCCIEQYGPSDGGRTTSAAHNNYIFSLLIYMLSIISH